ncbi:MAPEG family protein [Pararhizobium gei]|uniref:MAPEG family protein n=1 Tax=Pararhizobium gei TaxID=1395951 RepID=UPI0023DC135A|nr:MAPEG family protein [Rhizobium gei]
MDTAELAASPFLTLLGWSVVLLVFHVGLQGMTATSELGSAWNAGPRDGSNKPEGKIAGRSARASANFQETYPAFVGLALALAVAGEPGGWGLMGAWLWMICRIIYIPLYLAGVPYVRSLVWVGSIIGLLVMTGVLIF